ncbi:MAG: hypothetical protein ACFFEA_11960 [Candidatus Thorarchaeota archaeon]
MSGFIERRRTFRARIRSNIRLDIWLHVFTTLVLVLNISLILYTMVSVTIRMSLAGIGVLDSLPVMLYILPLMILLPLMVRAYYKDRYAPFNFVILLIASVFFGILSTLVRGFIIFLTLNAFALFIIFIMGRFRSKTSIRQVDRKTCAIILIINLLGLSFPIATLALGQTPLALIEPINEMNLALEVPLADFDFAYIDLNPSTSLLQNLSSSSVSVDLHLLEGDTDSMNRLRDWLTVLNQSTVTYTITMTAPRESFFEDEPISLGTASVIQAVYQSHLESLQFLASELDSLNMTQVPYCIYFDMTLSDAEWQLLMAMIRNLNLPGFSSLLRSSLDAIDSNALETYAANLVSESESLDLSSGVLIESFVLDDLQDFDSVAMKVCGQTVPILSQWDKVQVDCSRSGFSYEMEGDVGEYLSYSFSRSIAQYGPAWSMRLGAVGNGTDTNSRPNLVYNTLQGIAEDLVIAGGNGVTSLTLQSLPLLITAFGQEAVGDLMEAIDDVTQVGVTYTFRIYAFRAVFIAIDSFDLIMI